MGMIGAASDPEPGVTALAVNPTATKIFMGTNTGKLYVATLPTGMCEVFFIANLFEFFSMKIFYYLCGNIFLM